MNIQITQPELEALIQSRLKSGAFRDAEDLIYQAIQSSPLPEALITPDSRTLLQVFEGVRGLADDVDFSRDPSFGRPVDLS